MSSESTESSWSLAELRANYRVIQPGLGQMAVALEGWLWQTARELALHEPQISSRVKDEHSFALKAVRKGWAHPLTQASDKVGARIDVAYLDDVGRVIEAIETSEDFRVLRVDSKLETLPPEERASLLVYPGVNVDIMLMSPPEGILPEWGCCELQVRTLGQAAWAVAGHDLTYKPPAGVEVPWQLRRKMQRLLALTEIFDESVNEVRTELQRLDGYSTAVVRDALRSIWARFSSSTGSAVTTEAVLERFLADLDLGGTTEQLVEALRRFADENHERIGRLLDNYGEAMVMLGQPEAVLLLYSAEVGALRFARAWASVDLPWGWGADVAELWRGHAIPPPP